MSIQAQVEGVGTLEFPDGTDPSVVQATVKKVIAGKSGGGAAPKAPGAGYSLGEHADVAASLVSGAVAPMVGGIVKATGYAREGVEKLFGSDPGDANAAAAKLEESLTWSPRTDTGKKVMADVHKGMQAFEDWSDKQGGQAAQAVLAAGTKAAEVAKSFGAPQAVVDFIETHKEQLAAGYGAATKTTINAVPLALGGEAARVPGKIAEVGERLGAAPKPAATSPPATAPTAPVLETVSAPRGTPSTIGEGPTPTPSESTPRARAETYARDKLGVAWDDLAERTRAKLERVATDANGLERLKPEAVKRQAVLEGLKVPIKTTAGKLNRDSSQLLKEQGAAATDAGKSIRDTDVAAERGLRQNVEVLIDRLRGIGKSQAPKRSLDDKEGVGAAVAGRETETPGALTRKQQQAKARTQLAYKKARETEPNARVAADPMYEFVRGNPEVLNPAIQHLSWLNGWLKKAGIEKLDEEGKPTGEKRPIKLSELDDLRKKALSIAKGGGDSAHYAGEVISAIDKTFEEVPDAAKNWKAARDAHKSERSEFANQQAIERLVGTKGGAYGTDPKTALEDVWKVSVKNAKIDEIRQLKRSLLGGPDAATRLQGKQALRELRAETARDLLRTITKKVSTNEAGETNITAESINNWINGIGGREKLEVVIGRKATNDLMKIREAAQIVKTEPTVRNVGSNTFQKILNWMDDWVPTDVLKSTIGGPIKIAEKLYKTGENARIARAAEADATSVAERPGAKAQDKRLEEQLRQRRPPPTYGGSQ